MAFDPLVSVVVPIRNEAATIGRCLAALAAQDYPAERVEILVVDGASDDGTPDIVRAAASIDPRIRLLHNPARFAAQAMNVGLGAARGEVIARVDGHAIVPPDFLSRTVDALRRRPEVDCVSGALDTRGRTATGRAIAAAMSSTAGVGPARFRTGARDERLVDTVAFPVYRRSALDRIGRFDEELVRNQDDELNLRLTRAGGRILLLPDLRIVYFCHSTLRRMWRQYFEYGFWKVRVIQKHGRAASWRHLVPSALVAALVVAVVAMAAAPLRLPAAAIMAVYAAFVLVSTAALAVRHGVTLAPRIAAAIVAVHLGYGIGFWNGLLAFGVPIPGRPAAAAPLRPAGR
ncbi:MAG TPA: glycosyltransferase family 2 protein [Candidatus Binatia bacterium]|nr:glycosyltransferase family 2 protein [Candidatus Binatia bacterium]